MAYIDIDDLRTLVPLHVMQQLSDDEATGDVDYGLIEEVINEACEEVDGYLRGRYHLPFANTPTLVTQCAKQLVRYAIYERRPEGFELLPAVIDGRKIAIKNLINIRDGLITLGVADGELKGQQIADDGEFHVRVRPARDNKSTFNNELLDQW